MSTELVVQNIGSAVMAIAETKGKNYLVTSPLTGNEVKLDRDTDFGVIPGTKRPSLFKSGAEKIAMSYGLMQRYAIESKVEQFEGKSMLCFYTVRCDLVKGFTQADGTYHEVVYSSAYGSANTNEKRNGMNDCFNAANSTLKMAQKRALTSAVLAISGLSSMFTQDIEDEVSMKKADLIIKEDPNAPITQPQIKRLFAIMADAGMTQNEAKQKLAALGYASTKAIKQGEYDALIEKLKEGDK